MPLNWPVSSAPVSSNRYNFLAVATSNAQSCSLSLSSSSDVIPDTGSGGVWPIQFDHHKVLKLSIQTAQADQVSSIQIGKRIAIAATSTNHQTASCFIATTLAVKPVAIARKVRPAVAIQTISHTHNYTRSNISASVSLLSISNNTQTQRMQLKQSLELTDDELAAIVYLLAA